MIRQIFLRFLRDPLAGTLMAVDPSVTKVTKFITLNGEPYIIPYNSCLPIVVYVPGGDCLSSETL